MKLVKILCAGTVCLTILISAAVSTPAVEGPNIGLGKVLFESNHLGKANRSCATCHPNGRGLKETGEYSDQELKEMINFCIRDALKGKMLDFESTELTSILLYLRSF